MATIGSLAWIDHDNNGVGSREGFLERSTAAAQPRMGDVVGSIRYVRQQRRLFLIAMDIACMCTWFLLFDGYWYVTVHGVACCQRMDRGSHREAFLRARRCVTRIRSHCEHVCVGSICLYMVLI